MPEGAPAEPDWSEIFITNREFDDDAMINREEIRARSEASELWQDLVPLLDAAHMLALTDRIALTETCRLWARLNQQERMVSLTRSPTAIAMAKKYRVDLISLLGQLGLTPASRLRMSAPEGSPTSDAIERVLG